MTATYPDHAGFKLIVVIVNVGEGSKVLKYAREIGVTGGTIVLGHGTDSSRVAELLGLGTIRKEILMMVCNFETAATALRKLDEKFTFEKRRHGIAFSKPIESFIGSKDHIYRKNPTDREDARMDYHMITVIVNKGMGELVVEAARSAGATGGTIINARGAGTHETSKMFSIEIEPEKEIVMIVARAAKSERIYQAIRRTVDLDQPGTGIMFKQGVDDACGVD